MQWFLLTRIAWEYASLSVRVQGERGLPLKHLNRISIHPSECAMKEEALLELM